MNRNQKIITIATDRHQIIWENRKFKKSRYNMLNPIKN